MGSSESVFGVHGSEDLSDPSESKALLALDRALGARRMLLEALLRLLVAPGMLGVGMTPQEIKGLLEKHIVSMLKEEGLLPPAIADILARSTRWVYRVQETGGDPLCLEEATLPTVREFVLATLASLYPRQISAADVHRRVLRDHRNVEVETVRNLLVALRIEGWLVELRTPVIGCRTAVSYQFRTSFLELDDVAGVERRNNLWESLPLLEALLTEYAMGSPEAGLGGLEARMLAEQLPEFHQRMWSTMRQVSQELTNRARERDPDELETWATIRGLFGFCRTA